MTFQRSAGSLHSMHLFFRVDVVVYCEGGPSLSVEQALSHTNTPRTMDGIYWAKVLEFMEINKSYHFKSVGSKLTLKAIASQIAAVGCSNITICFDADYDRQLGVINIGPRIAYTHGYSWESDVISRKIAHAVLNHFVGPPPPVVTMEMDATLDKLESELAPWCEVDIALKARRKPCVFDRDKYLSVVDMQQNPVCLKDLALQARLANAGYKRKPKKIVNVQKADSLKVTFGKLVSKMIFHIVRFYAQKVVGKEKFDYDGFMRAAVTETFRLVQAGGLPTFRAHLQSTRPMFT